MTNQLTCIACRALFDDADAQRAHYKCDWHRYNLKRKVAELPPVTHGEFNRIVQYHTEKREEKMLDKILACQTCNKSFSSDNAYENHLKSKKHKEMLNKPAGKSVSKSEFISICYQIGRFSIAPKHLTNSVLLTAALCSSPTYGSL